MPDSIGTEVRRAVLAGHKLRIHYAAMDFSDAEHAEWALWQLATHAEALAPQWLRTALRNRAAAIATCNEASSES